MKSEGKLYSFSLIIVGHGSFSQHRGISMSTAVSFNRNSKENLPKVHKLCSTDKDSRQA